MVKRFFIILILIFSLSGCYNYEELNDIAIISAIGVDYNNDNFNVSYQVINSNNNSDSGFEQASFVVYNYLGETIQETARNVSLLTSKKMYGSHMKVLILSEEAVNNHLAEIIDFFYRNPDIRNEFYVLISRNETPENVLKIITPLVNLSSEEIVSSLKRSNKTLGVNELITFSDLMHKYLNPHIEISIPSINVIGNDNTGDEVDNLKTSNYDANVELSTMGIFKDNKILGYLTLDESISYNLIKGDISKAVIDFECDDGKFVVADIHSLKSKLKVNKNGEINLLINGNASIAEVHCKLNLKSEKTIISLNKMLNKKIDNMVSNTFNNIINNYKTDIFGIEDNYYKNDYKYYQTIKSNWNDYFKNLKIKVNSNVKFISKGNGLGGIYEMENK